METLCGRSLAAEAVVTPVLQVAIVSYRHARGGHAGKCHCCQEEHTLSRGSSHGTGRGQTAEPCLAISDQRGHAIITETNRIQFALCGMQNRAFGPYLMTNNRILISQELVTWLAEQPSVHWVAPKSRVYATNFYAAAILQSGAAPPQYDLDDMGDPTVQHPDNGTHPLWGAGLQARIAGQP
jgi:hypothetical protein